MQYFVGYFTTEILSFMSFHFIGPACLLSQFLRPECS